MQKNTCSEKSDLLQVQKESQHRKKAVDRGEWVCQDLANFSVKDQTVNRSGSMGHICVSGNYSTLLMKPKQTQNLKSGAVVFRQNLIH